MDRTENEPLAETRGLGPRMHRRAHALRGPPLSLWATGAAPEACGVSLASAACLEKRGPEGRRAFKRTSKWKGRGGWRYLGCTHMTSGRAAGVWAPARG